MRHRIVRGVLLFCAGLLALVQPAKADSMNGITFTVTNPDLTESPGAVLIWNYTLADKNPDSLDVFVLDLNVPAAFGVGDGNPMNLFSAPALLTNGSTQTGALYEFFSDPSVPNSINKGFFDLTVILQDGQGHPVGLPFDLTENYSATITTSTGVPEPGTLLLLVSGLLAGLPLIRRSAH